MLSSNFFIRGVIMTGMSKWLKGSHDIFRAYDVWKFNKDFRAEHPEYFDPDGIIVFCGSQGAGKTISAVQYVQRLCDLYPAVKVCTNMELVLPESIEVIPWTGVKCFTDISNGYAGVIYLIDEIHLEFNSLESKKMDSGIFEVVSQQRKQRKHIVGTSQVFNRIAKPFREQFKYVVACNCLFHCLQINTLLDAKKCSVDDSGQIVASSLKKFVWMHTPELYKSYDTYAVMSRLRKDWGDM